jgi:hypothetical protein
MMATVGPLPNSAGINSTSPVTVSFSATDTLSGVASCTLPITLTTSGTAKGTCIDNAGNSASVSKTVTIVDPPPSGGNSGSPGPTIQGIPAAGACVLRPANNQLVHAATLWVEAAQTAAFDVTATSNQPPAAGKNDIVITGADLHPRNIRLRAERPSNGTDRIYTVTAKATGKSGQTTIETFTCTVSQERTGDGDQDHDDGQQSGSGTH